MLSFPSVPRTSDSGASDTAWCESHPMLGPGAAAASALGLSPTADMQRGIRPRAWMRLPKARCEAAPAPAAEEEHGRKAAAGSSRRAAAAAVVTRRAVLVRMATGCYWLLLAVGCYAMDACCVSRPPPAGCGC